MIIENARPWEMAKEHGLQHHYSPHGYGSYSANGKVRFFRGNDHIATFIVEAESGFGETFFQTLRLDEGNWPPPAEAGAETGEE